MAGQHLRTINIIYIVIGIIIIVCSTKISSDNARQQTGAYFVYNQIGLNQANKLRKLYWYTMGQPMLTARKQRMGNFQMKPRYQNVPLQMSASYVNPMRTPYRNAYDGGISANALKSYMTSVSLPTTSMPKIQPSVRFQPSKQYEELPFEDAKSCTEKNLTVTAKESIITVPNNIRPPFEIISNSMSPQYTNIAPITPAPIVPYVSHTYFTLDDVVIPSSSDNLLYYKPERKERISKETPPPFTTQRSQISNNLTVDILDDEIFDIVPMEKSKNRIQTTMSWMPTAKYRNRIQTTMSWMPTSTIIVKNETKMDLKSISLNQNLPSDVFNILTELKNFTSFPNFKTLSKSEEEICNSCEKRALTTTLNTILNDVDDKQLDEFIENKAAKVVEENIYTTTESLKSPTSTTFSNLLATKLKIAQNHKKFFPLTSKKNSYNAHLGSTTTTSSTEAPQARKSRRTKTYSRQRKIASNFTRLNNYNLTNAKATYSKILRPTTKSVAKNRMQSQNVTEIPSSASPETKKPIVIRSTPSVIRSTAISKPVSSPNLTETTALASESAIMTISNANGRNFRGTMPTFRKRLPEPPKGIVHTTAIPQLPIELYFNKLSKTQ